MKAQSGFTLIEVLIAMTLLGLIMVMLYQAMNLGSRSWNYAEATATEVAEMRDSYGFIRKQINRIQPLRQAPGSPQSKADKAFLGEHEALRFIANLPNNIGIAGPVIHVLEVERGDNGVQMRLKLTMDHPDAEWELTAEDDSIGYVLFSGAEEVTFEYFGAKGLSQNPDWHDRWTEDNSLPELIKLSVTFPDDHAPWPALTAKIQVNGVPTNAGLPGRRSSNRGGDVPAPIPGS